MNRERKEREREQDETTGLGRGGPQGQDPGTQQERMEALALFALTGGRSAKLPLASGCLTFPDAHC